MVFKHKLVEAKLSFYIVNNSTLIYFRKENFTSQKLIQKLNYKKNHPPWTMGLS